MVELSKPEWWSCNVVGHILYTFGLYATFWNMNSSVRAIWAAQGSKAKKRESNFEQFLRVVFKFFMGQKTVVIAKISLLK